jgi:hypothetical protein
LGKLCEGVPIFVSIIVIPANAGIQRPCLALVIADDAKIHFDSMLVIPA